MFHLSSSVIHTNASLASQKQILPTFPLDYYCRIVSGMSSLNATFWWPPAFCRTAPQDFRFSGFQPLPSPKFGHTGFGQSSVMFGLGSVHIGHTGGATLAIRFNNDS